MYTIENVREVLGRVLWILAIGVKVTPNKIDDKVVEVATTLLSNDAIMSLLVAFLNSTQKDNTKPSEERIVAAFMEHFVE
jgi:hypothetical protein